MLEFFCYKQLTEKDNSKLKIKLLPKEDENGDSNDDKQMFYIEQPTEEDYTKINLLGGKSCKMADALSFLFYLIISIFAFYLSWDCNTLRGLSLPVKMFYGFFAFMFGSLYLLFYIIFINGTCIPQSIPKL